VSDPRLLSFTSRYVCPCNKIYTGILRNKQIKKPLGAEVDSFKKGDWTSLMVSCAQTGPEVPQIVKILLNNGADAELINKDGWTAMHIASRTGQLDTVQLLAEHRSNLVTTPSRNGRIPLHIACNDKGIFYHLLNIAK